MPSDKKPQLFAVIDIQMWNGSISDVRCMKTFTTWKEASDFIGCSDYLFVVEIK